MYAVQKSRQLRAQQSPVLVESTILQSTLRVAAENVKVLPDMKQKWNGGLAQHLRAVHTTRHTAKGSLDYTSSTRAAAQDNKAFWFTAEVAGKALSNVRTSLAASMVYGEASAAETSLLSSSLLRTASSAARPA